MKLVLSLLAALTCTACVATSTDGCIRAQYIVCDRQVPQDMLFLTDEEWIAAYGEPRGESDDDNE